MGATAKMKRYRYATLMALAFLILLQPGCTPKQDRPAENKEKAETRKTDTVGQISVADAAFRGDLKTIETLLQQGVDVNQTDTDGRTALMLAAYNGHTEIVKLLLEHKAFVNVPDVKGRTALMFAASGPFPEIVRLLLDHQADPNLADYQEHFTALMYAAAEGQQENVKILLEGNADPLLKDADGDMALTFARNNGHAEVAEILNTYSNR